MRPASSAWGGALIRTVARPLGEGAQEGRILFGFIALAFSAGVVFADTVYLTRGGEYTDGVDLSEAQGSAETWKDYYSDRQRVHAGADYVYSSVYNDGGGTKTVADPRIRVDVGISAAAAVFAGDSLQVGSFDPAGTFTMNQRRISGEEVTATWNRMILCAGKWVDYDDGNSPQQMGGNYEVLSPAAAPFHFYSEKSNNREWRMFANLSGTSSVGLRFSRNGKANGWTTSYRFSGDNRSYKGRMTVEDDGCQLLFADAAAFGASDGAMPDAITLAKGGAIGAFGSGEVRFGDGSRGITVAATGGAIHVPAGVKFVLEAPITGVGAVSVRGGGQLVLNAAYSAGDIAIESGTRFQRGVNFTAAPGVKVLTRGTGAIVCELPTAGASAEIDLAAHDGEVFTFPVDGANGPGFFNVTGVGAVWPIRFALDGWGARPAPGVKFALMKIPTSVRTVTAEDFFLSGTAPRSEKFSVTTEDGVQTVFIEFPTVISAANINNSISQWNIGGAAVELYNQNWADYFSANHPDWGLPAGYVNLGGTRRFHVNHSGEKVGTPFSLKGESAANRMNACLKANGDYVWPDIRFYGDTYMYPNGCAATFKGRLGIFASKEHPAEFNSSNEGTVDGTWLRIESAIYGDGSALFAAASNAAVSHGRRIFLYGDNSRFLGTFDFAGDHTVVVTNGTAFGGNPAVFASDAVRFRDGLTLVVEGDVDFSARNRGVSIANEVTIDVAVGRTFSLSARTTLSDTLVKTGSGVLVLDDLSLGETTATLVIKDGLVSFGAGGPPAGLRIVRAGGMVLLPLPAAGTESAAPVDCADNDCAYSFVAGSRTGCFMFAPESLPSTFPLVIDYSFTTRPIAGVKYPIFKIPTSLRMVTKWDFISFGTIPRMEKYSVETIGDAQIVSVEFPEVMKAANINYDIETWTVDGRDGTIDIRKQSYPDWWTRADWPRYACLARKIDKDTYRWNGYWGTSFPGDSLSVQGIGTKKDRYYVCAKNASYVIDDLRFYEYMYYRRNGADSRLEGHLLIAGSEIAPSVLEIEQTNGTLTIQSEIRGQGWLQAVAGYRSTDEQSAYPIPGGVLTFSGDNHRFLGTLEVKPSVWPMNANSLNDLTVKVSTADQLGGNPSAFVAKATRIFGANVLEATDDIFTTATNRGYYFADQPKVKVAAEKTFSLVSPVLLAGTLEKVGAGTLALAGVTAETGAVASAVAVSEGALDLVRPAAVSNVAFTVTGPGSLTIRLSRAAIGTPGLVNVVDDEPFGAAGDLRFAWADGEGLAPSGLDSKASIPLMTVKSAAAPALSARVSCAAGMTGEYAVRAVDNGDGSTTLFVDGERPSGMILIFK